jgi:branched-chain amino acid transport system permease protein
VSIARATGEDRAPLLVAGTVIDRGRLARAGVIAAFLAVALFVLPLAGGDWTKTFTSVAIYAVVAAGLGVLYGRVGMISLGQIALLEIGVWIAARIAYATHAIPFPLLIVVTGLITGVIGILVGLPALRLSGLYLALITLMFAGAVNVVLSVTNFPNGGKGFTGHIAAGDLAAIENVRRPSIAEGDNSYYRYVVIVCALTFVLALIHFAGKPGRAWAAIRESEPAALAAGVNVTVYKLWAFALASFMTGVAGCLLAAHQGQPTAYGFSTQDSLTVLATALIGGIYSLWGAIVAGVFIQLLPFILKDQWGVNNNFLIVIFGVGLLQVLLTAPGGLAQQFPKDMANLGRLLWKLGRRVTGRAPA